MADGYVHRCSRLTVYEPLLQPALQTGRPGGYD
jgi:hypothetical protein